MLLPPQTQRQVAPDFSGAAYGLDDESLGVARTESKANQSTFKSRVLQKDPSLHSDRDQDRGRFGAVGDFSEARVRASARRSSLPKSRAGSARPTFASNPFPIATHVTF